MAENNQYGHAHRCGGIPYFPTESLYDELKNNLNEKQMESYKNRVEKYYGEMGIKFPWEV